MSKNLRDQNPMDYDFPELEEYFIYNPKSRVRKPMQTNATRGIKLQKTP